jgi:hypothetical protein
MNRTLQESDLAQGITTPGNEVGGCKPEEMRYFSATCSVQ